MSRGGVYLGDVCPGGSAGGCLPRGVSTRGMSAQGVSAQETPPPDQEQNPPGPGAESPCEQNS